LLVFKIQNSKFSYSAGSFGGITAAMALKVHLSMLGCIPVSKICPIPSVFS
jgi:hypothetical protein